jgi:orotate phosphoribosyltransferase
MDPDATLALFRRAGALLEGHFKLSSGLHSGGYLQSALVLQTTADAAALGAALGAWAAMRRPEVVLSPALGGLIIGHEVARALGVRAIFAERADGGLTLRRGFSIGSEERVLIVEDVVTTGRSTLETIEVAETAGGRVVAAVAIIDRSGGSVDLRVPFHALAQVSFPAYPPSDCPLCAEGWSLNKPGSRP